MISEIGIGCGVPVERQHKFSYGLIEKREIESAARIYVQSFPQRFSGWFRNERMAMRFYCDLFELMRLAHRDTFFVARDGQRLVGYLVLTRPRTSLFRAMWRDAFFLRVARALTGRYGFSLNLMREVLRSLLGSPTLHETALDAPHVYVVVVHAEYTGRGIGSTLIEQARRASEEYGRMWLNVEVGNTDAVRLYERMGFRIVQSDLVQHAMVWDFPGSEAGALPG